MLRYLSWNICCLKTLINVNELTEYTLTKFMYDPNLGKTVHKLEDRAAIQRDLTGKLATSQQEGNVIHQGQM